MKKMFMTLMSAATLLIASPILANTFIVGDDDKFVYIQADGTGTNKIEALNSAWVEAIRTAVGMYITGKTHINNDDMQEKITAYSRGKVKTYEIISENQQDGLWNIAIKAAVEKDMLVQSEKSIKKRGVSSSKVAALVTSAGQSKDARDTLENVRIYGSPDECLDYSFDIQNVNGKIYAFHLIKVNHKKYSDIVVKNIAQILDEFSEAKFESYPHSVEADRNSRIVSLSHNFSIPENFASLKGRNGGPISLEHGTTLLSAAYYDHNMHPYNDFDFYKRMPDKYRNDFNWKLGAISIVNNHKKCTTYMIQDRDLVKKIWKKIRGSEYALTFFTDVECGTENFHFDSDTLDVVFFASYSFYHPESGEGHKVFPLMQIQKNGMDQRSLTIFIAQEIDIAQDKISKITNVNGGYELTDKK